MAEAGWIDRLREMTYEELELQYTPLIAKYSRWRIPGYDPDDIAQEVRLTLWKCQQRFDPESKKGYAGRPSSFTNYLITAIENTLGKAPRRFAQSYYSPVTGLECVACGEQAPIVERQVCRKCGGRRWKAVHGGTTVPIEGERLQFESGGFEDFVVEMVSAGVPEALREDLAAFADEAGIRYEIAGAGATVVQWDDVAGANVRRRV